jgi:hypothetical protein
MRLCHLIVVCSLLALAVPASGVAAERMWLGFQDDPSLRWRDDRTSVFDIAQQLDATIVRTTVYWSRIAPTKPAVAGDPMDPAYSFFDLDELVRNAQARGMEVMLTIWGTPAWANGGKGQNYAPTNYNDLRDFAFALASRYSGAYPGIPFVRYYTVWNESNLGQFLSPQFASNGKPAAPFIYAKLYAAAYTGIKAGNRSALVGIGETSARGRDKPLHSKTQQDTESPGRFAQLLSTVRPRLKFSAYSEHPYSTSLTAPPTQKVRFPNVTLSELGKFEGSLDKWFGRKNIPVWITEYGYQTRPQEPHGVTYAKQATYARTALNIARNDSRVQMFIWFIIRDDPTSTWQSGLLEQGGAKKPAFSVFSGLDRLFDARNAIIQMKAGITKPIVRIAALEIAARSGPGSVVGVSMNVFTSKGKLAGSAQPQAVVGLDGYLSVPVPIRTHAHTRYGVYCTIEDANGNRVSRSLTLVVP